MGAAARLAELGLELPAVALPLAAYVPALRSGSYVYTSGQLPFVAGALPATGKVGIGAGLISPEEAAGYAQTSALNALAAVAAVVAADGGPQGADALDRIVHVVKVVGFVASDPAFTGQPAVVNGASLLLHAVLGEAGVHARSAVGVAVLPMDSPVEVEIVVELA
ncbi:RidA family protein [Cellulomonas sp.]|uniref:RidA family protein n=1 Tax=Cellulomonas sp. TaxID=40001 RepID=UPI003BAC38A5